jgi:transcriptional regulator CtsR
MKRFPWVIFSVLIIVISSMLPLPLTGAAPVEARRSPLEDLINGADSVVVGTVVEHSSYWNDEHTGIYTSVVLSVEERLKGTMSQDRITITFPGGEVDEIGEWVSDMSSFDQGERVLVFLKKLSKAQLSEEQFEVYGGFRGKFTITGDKVGNLPLAQFKERVSNVLKGQTLADWELDVPLSVATSPYSYSGLSWPHPPAPVVNYRINENCADCTGEGAAVQAAAATWNAAGAQFSFSYAGTTTATTASYDGVNEIMWRNFGSGGTIALTTTWYYTSNNNIVECDIEFNDYYTFSTASTPPSGQYDVQTIALHEFGHFLMLDDLYNAADSAKVMYGYGSPGTTKRALHADDIAGIRYIYGVSPTPPNAPSDLIATPISSSQINLSWQDNSDDETGFKIERKTGSGSYAQIATAGAGVTSYSDTSLSAGTTYYYRVRAYSAAGNSAYSNEASATTLPLPPSAPTLKSPASVSTVSNLTPRLEWNASSGAVSYGVQVSTSSSFASLLVNETGITNLYYDIAPEVLNWSTTYYWRVNARNSFGSVSNWSSYWYFKTAIGPPSNLVATPISSSQINLIWQDNSSDETGFKIERKTGSGSYSQIATVGVGVTSYSNTGLTASTTYYYWVRAYNTAGNSAYSNEASATTLPPPPPAPTLKSPASASTVSSLTPRLEWNASSGAVSYGIQISISSSFANLVVNETGIANLYYDIAPGILKWNTTYYWRVNARNSFGSTSSWSTSRYFKTAIGPPPNAPSDLVATPISSSQINLTWQDNSSDETGFKIERKTGSGSYSQIATVGANVTSYSNSGLSASTTYYYRVRAYSAAGNSDYSNEASATTLPPPPSGPTLKSPASGSTVATLTPRLEWNASSGATDYGLQVATTSSFTTLLVNETGITNLYYDIAPGILKWNTTYYWRVNARNSFGSTSSWSTSRYFKTAVGPPPNAPSNLIATPTSSSQINLTWQDNSSDETGFKIERKTGSGSYSQIATVSANVTSYSNTLLSANTTYYYRVRAYKGTLNSDYCEEASATTLPPPPPAPTLKSPASASTVSNLTPRLEWNASSGAVSYGIQVSTSSSFANLVVNETGITNLYYDIAPGILNWNTTYYWRVNARNSFGSTSSWSSYRYFRTPAGP